MSSPDTTRDPDDSLSRQVDEICARFKAALISGSSPRIEDYLAQPPGDADCTLFLELVKLEVDYRVQFGESPTPDEYAERFPEHAALIQHKVNQLLQTALEKPNAAPIPATVTELPATPTDDSSLHRGSDLRAESS